jgi:hypothetical protein
LDAVLDPVKEIERDLSDAYRRKREEWEAESELAAISLAQWKADAKAAMAEGGTAPSKPDDADAGTAPIRERICVADVTAEKAADLLSRTWRGLRFERGKGGRGYPRLLSC